MSGDGSGDAGTLFSGTKRVKDGYRRTCAVERPLLAVEDDDGTQETSEKHAGESTIKVPRA